MLVALRATHERLDLAVLDALSRGAERLADVIGQVNGQAAVDPQDAPIAGWVVVSTCNRLEIYLDARRFHDAVELVAECVASTSGLELPQVRVCLEAAMGRPVVEHLDEVTAGLRSVVIGEAEISGQVRAAFEAAQRAGRTTAMLNDLFQLAFRTAKQVVARTPVGAAGRSGVAVALDRAEKLLGPLRERRVLVIGTGAYARLGVAELARRGCRDVAVHSGSGRAESFARSHGVRAVESAELEGALRAADLVLACSGRGTSIFPVQVRGIGPTLILDLALHSDLHPLVRLREDVRVLDLTDLPLEEEGGSRPALDAARSIIAEGVDQFCSRQEFRRVDPAMAALRASVSAAADAEVARLRRERPADVADDVERSIRRILAKVLHPPTERARRLALEGNADEFVAAFHTIFGIDISTGSPEPGPDGAPDGWMRLDQTAPSGDALPVGAGVATGAGGMDPAVPETRRHELEAQLAQIAAIGRTGAHVGTATHREEG